LSQHLAPYFRLLKQSNADHLLLLPGESIAAVLDGQQRSLGGASVSPRTILALAGEVLSQEELRDLPNHRPRIVRHEQDGESYVIEVAREGNAVKMGIRVAQQQKPAAHARPAASPAARVVEIEEAPKRRHSKNMRVSQRPPGRNSRAPKAAVESAAVDIAIPRHAHKPVEIVTPSFDDGPRPIDALLREMIAKSASDLHLSAGSPPVMRVHGEIAFLRDRGAMKSEEILELVRAIMTDRARKDYDELRDADFAYEVKDLARFRVNVFEDRNGTGAVLRQIPIKVIPADELGLPKACLDLCYLTKGLVVVTGPTGSGKSTTLAAMIDHVNKNRSDHIITIEDPVEFVHPNIKCLVNQREVGANTKSFKAALRAALREDPDIVLVGEMRDLETIAIAIETAETGHLVFGTLHTTTATSTIDRIIDQFPPDRQAQIRVMLSESLKGVIAQVLCKRIGGGRVAAHEILLGTSAVTALVRDGKTFQLPSVMQTSRAAGMVTLNDSLLSLVQRRLVDPKEAWMKAVDKNGLLAMFKSQNIPTAFG
jgi:twitching motility protein PilT